MNRKRARELLPIIQAFADGDEIERKNPSGSWAPLLADDLLDTPTEYRIKPKPREFWINTMTSKITDYEDPHVLLEPNKSQKGWIKVIEVLGDG